MNNIKDKCKKLYDSEFFEGKKYTDLLFERFFEKNCRYIIKDGEPVSLLFVFDVTLGNYCGKYVFAAVTKKELRSSGFMSRLLGDVIEEFNKYDFLCLKPSNDSLFDYYSRFGFTAFFNAETSTVKSERTNRNHILLKPEDYNTVLRNLNLKYVSFENEYLSFLSEFYNAFTDSIENPSFFALKDLFGRCTINELAGDIKKADGIFDKNSAVTLHGKGTPSGMILKLNKEMSAVGNEILMFTMN